MKKLLFCLLAAVCAVSSAWADGVADLPFTATKRIKAGGEIWSTTAANVATANTEGWCTKNTTGSNNKYGNITPKLEGDETDETYHKLAGVQVKATNTPSDLTTDKKALVFKVTNTTEFTVYGATTSSSQAVSVWLSVYKADGTAVAENTVGVGAATNKTCTATVSGLDENETYVVNIIGGLKATDGEIPQTSAGGQDMVLYAIKFAAPAAGSKLESDLTPSTNTVYLNRGNSATVTYTTSSTGYVTARSNNTNVATVTYGNGEVAVTGVAVGTATITINQKPDATYLIGAKDITVTVVDPAAPTVVYNWNTVGTTTLAGTATTGNVSVKGISTFGIKFGNGLSADNYLKIESNDGGFKKGDVITWTGCIYNPDNTKQGTIMIVSNEIGGTTLTSGSLFNNTYDATVEPSTGSFTLTEDAECLYIGRATSGISNATATWLTQLTVSRAKTTMSIEISSAGYATYVTPCALDFSESDVTAYAVTPDLTNDQVTLTPVAKVPAGKAIVVKGDEGTHDVQCTASAEEFDTSLEVSATDTRYDADYTYYYLGVENGTVGFRPLAESGSIAAGKCFFKVEKDAGAHFLSLSIEDDNVATGIQSVTAKANNGVAYNLAGQRVAANAKGIVIVNGKKMFNK